jgi:hypothetical protein
MRACVSVWVGGENEKPDAPGEQLEGCVLSMRVNE